MSAHSQIRSPIRLALVITELAVGGAERNLVRLATGLHGDGFEVRVFSLKRAPEAPRDELARQLESAQLPVTFFDAQSAWQIPGTTRRMAREFRAWRPDVVQSFLFHANVVSTWACRLARVRNLVWGLRVADPNPRRIWLERKLVGNARMVACVSGSVRQFALEEIGIEAEKLRVIPNGLNPADYESVQPIDLATVGVPQGRRMLLCVGRLHEQKGYDWLLKFAPEMLFRLPEHDLVFVGDGPERDRLKSMAAESGMGQRIHFVGFRDDVPRWLAAADLLLLPSRWEGMPNVVLEAMASGRPVVATASHGVAELLGELAPDQLVPLGDASEFQQKVLSLLADDDRAKELGAANRRRAQTVYSISNTLASHRQLYHTLASS